MFNQLKFVSDMIHVAADEEGRSGIKSLITISQAAHESGWGGSKLTEKANNLFGFTGEGWEQEGKPVVRMPTDEWIEGSLNNTTGLTVPGRWVTVQRPFRAYSSWAESVRDWSNLMHANRYAAAFARARDGDLPGFAREVHAAGYATDPHYASALTAVGVTVQQVLKQITSPGTDLASADPNPPPGVA